MLAEFDVDVSERRGWHMPLEMGSYGHQRASYANGFGKVRAEEKATGSGSAVARSC